MGTVNTKFTVSEDSYPRYVFMKKQINGLLNRERKFCEKLNIPGSDIPVLSNEEGDNIVIDVVRSSSCDQVIGEQDILIRSADCNRTKTERNDDYLKELMLTDKHYPLLKTTFIKIEQTIGQNKFTGRIVVAQNKAAIKTLSKMMKRKLKVTVCLKESVSKEISKVLERNAFQGLKEPCEYICTVLKDAALDEYAKTAERLLYDMIGLYSRSQVPEHERPKIALHERRKISSELLQDFRDVSTKINWCGYYDNFLYVFVDEETPSMMLHEQIQDVLKKHKISKYKIGSSLIKPFAACSSGSKAQVYPDKNSQSTFGTVAGYIRSDVKKRLHALISRHVALKSYDRKVYISKDKCYVKGNIVEQTNRNNKNKREPSSASEERMGNILDVAAASIDQHQELKCDFNYKTEDNDAVPGKLCEYEPHQLQGLNVHIWGASSGLGLGRIAIPTLKSVQEPPGDGSYIAVVDRDSDSDANCNATASTQFCREGDSGSMVCTHDPDTNGEKVQLISMVIGKNLGQDQLYTTVKLKDGLNQIENDIGEKVLLC